MSLSEGEVLSEHARKQIKKVIITDINSDGPIAKAILRSMARNKDRGVLK